MKVTSVVMEYTFDRCSSRNDVYVFTKRKSDPVMTSSIRPRTGLESSIGLCSIMPRELSGKLYEESTRALKLICCGKLAAVAIVGTPVKKKKTSGHRNNLKFRVKMTR